MVDHIISDNDTDIWKLYQTARHIIDILGVVKRNPLFFHSMQK